jgi:hypothetical protein
VAGTTTLTLPAATDTLVGKATTDTLTNKTLTGAVMNGTLGATTPSTVAATTISASSTATFAAGAVGTPSITTSGDTNTGIFFPAADTIAFAEGGAEVARFDSSGNFGLGVTPKTIDLGKSFEIGVAGSGLWSTGSATDIRMMSNVYYNAGYKFAGTGYAAVFLANAGAFVWQRSSASGTVGNAVTASDVMTLDVSGNLLLGGTTSYGGKIQGISTYIRSANGQSSQNVGFVASDLASNEWHFGRSSVDGYYYVVRQTGTGMYMNTNAWVATSDIRAKENIVPLESSLAKINSLNPVRFTFKKDGMADVGFIAQEMYEQIPEVVDKPEDEEAMMGISKEKIIPFLVKAIQEQQALITTLTARITALESA